MLAGPYSSMNANTERVEFESTGSTVRKALLCDFG